MNINFRLGPYQTCSLFREAQLWGFKRGKEGEDEAVTSWLLRSVTQFHGMSLRFPIPPSSRAYYFSCWMEQYLNFTCNIIPVNNRIALTRTICSLWGIMHLPITNLSIRRNPLQSEALLLLHHHHLRRDLLRYCCCCRRCCPNGNAAFRSRFPIPTQIAP